MGNGRMDRLKRFGGGNRRGVCNKPSRVYTTYMERIHITIPVIVEGRYDRAKVAEVTDAPVFTTEGFGIFTNPEKLAMFRRIGEKGILLLCDSDGAGSVIRGHLRSALPADRVYDLYTPQIVGKERRKRKGSKAGFLGVEGVDGTILRSLFERFLLRHPECGGEVRQTADAAPEPITKTDLYEWGMTGQPDAGALRDRFCAAAGLPAAMTPNAFLAALNILYTRTEAAGIAQSLK